jgi:two-component system sensor histidine kinase RegB
MSEHEARVGVVNQPWYLSATPVAALPWLVRLRWANVTVDGLVLAVAFALPAADFPLRPLTPLVAASALAHAVVAACLTRGRAVPRAAGFVALVVDIALLTGLLDLTGGPFNPFAVMYAVQVALGAVTLGRVPATLLGLAAVGSFATLLVWHSREGLFGHHRITDFPTHLFLMWLALGATAELVMYFLVQASSAIERMRLRAARSERLAALTTLAAGAAHELSTPLGTIALAARELERAATRGAGAQALVGDARLIRTEVDRCRSILDQMSGRALGTAVDLPEAVELPGLFAEVARELPSAQAARLEWRTAPALPPVQASRAGLRRAVLSLVANAFDASPPDGPVRLVAEPSAGVAGRGGVRIEVRDEGPGMAPAVLARAGEPFFTTKDPGRGLGLGLFLARLFAERNGGSLSFHTGGGTTAVLDLPLRAEEGHNQ